MVTFSTGCLLLVSSFCEYIPQTKKGVACHPDKFVTRVPHKEQYKKGE